MSPQIILFSKDHPLYFPFFISLGKEMDVRAVIIENTTVSTQLKTIFPGARFIAHETLHEKKEILKDLTAISFFYNKYISPAFLSLFKGAFNFHGSLLPNYSGAHALNWQLIKGEVESGITIHELSPQIDGGSIVAQQSFKIDITDTALTLLQKQVYCAQKMLQSFLSKLQSNTFEPVSQNSKSTHFKCSLRFPEDGKLTREMSPREIYNTIRALVSPWPNAFYDCHCNGKISFPEILPLNECENLHLKLIQNENQKNN